MSYDVKRKDDMYHVELFDEPKNCRALEMSPSTLEGFLCEGVWLVLLFAVWSTPDRKEIEMALRFAKNKGINLGIRPFEDFDENSNWCPELTGQFGSPIWLLYDNGNLKNRKVGLCSESDLKDLVGIV
ncbi:hypothetical protein [Pleionea sp. CnH1-48]|uniref:hypothetical protein n=1 Tax=Pleionea sp. CnH1-48 TaxID=2954494 RepID=UPI002096A6EB|nr:hypothetical protein [Pleionea sp. CnH1-48]MCO7223562.1 hypothetical protein [Pleionea sp. CnH1-48]